MMIRRIVLAALLCLVNSPLLAAPDCPIPAYTPKTTDLITDWHQTYISPAMAAIGLPASPRPTKEQTEALVERLDAFHHRGISEPLFFESLTQQIATRYEKAGDFKGLNTSVAEKLYKSGSGASLDFTALCIDTRQTRFSDDTFAITLFGVNNYECSHASLRGLVFTGTLVNGGANGECRPDHVYYKRLIIPVKAGTNTITFVCNKDANGCAQR